MKKTVLMLFLALSLISWNKKTIDYTLISGVITNKTQDLKITSRNQNFSKTLKIAPDGSFKDTLRVDEGTYFIFDGKNYAPLYIEKGGEIIVSADAKNFMKSIAFSGKGSAASSYLLTKALTRNQLLGEDVAAVYSIEETAFKSKFTEVKNTLMSILDAAQGLSETFKSREKRNINYGYLVSLSKYEDYHGYYTKKEDFKVSQDFLSEMPNITFVSAEDYKYCDDYKILLSLYFEKQASLMAKSEGIADDLALLKTYAKIQEPSIKNSLLFAAANEGITYSNDLQEYYKVFMGASSSDEHKKIITGLYEELKKIGKGVSSPKFSNYENFAGGTTSLDDLKGKFVYIDVWATWCGPCKAEIPFLQKMESAYHAKNIAFVSISVDKAKSHDKWKEMVANGKMGGIQLFADNDFDSQFIKDYLINAIPRFILIDPQGKIISANAPRPYDESGLTSLFTKLGI